MRKAFTLVELMVVVVIIGILATLAIPQYAKAIERAKVGKAKHALPLIVQANKMYGAENNAYTSTMATLNNYIELPDQTGGTVDADWNYAASTDGSATATREGAGEYGTKTIVLNADGTWGGGTNPHPLR